PHSGAWRMHERDDNPSFVGVIRADFERAFPINAVGVNPKNTTVRDRGGRRPMYDWDEFFCEIIRRANTPDGLPDRAKLTEAMKEWCRQNWDKEPSDSLLREKIAKVYDALDREP